jgi:radical SAM protein with 4Fe4S-binding SPASM domain
MKSFGFQWHITDRCNLTCSHCYQTSFTSRREKNADDLHLMANRIFEALPDRQISVNLTGGEPLLFPHLLTLAEHLHRFPNLEEIHIITNGTVTKTRVLEAIRQYPKIISLKVSLEGGSSPINDPIRGSGNLEKVRKNIALYKERTLKPIIIMTTLAKYNLGDIEKTVDFARANGAEGIIFERFVPLGTGKAISHQTLGPRDWKNAIQAITKAAGLKVDATSLLSYKAFWLWFDTSGNPTLDGALCNLGDESMALMPDGTVFPCRRLPLPVGNVLNDSFDQILDRLTRFHPSEIQTRLTGNLCGMCGIESCAGCRALARALENDVLADDPQCVLQLP